MNNPSPPATATLGQAYSYTFAASGSPAPTWSVASGALPVGLALNATTGKLSGTPSAGGTATFTVKADNGAPPASTSQPLTITVDSPPVFTAQSPPTTATAGSFYFYRYEASGEPAPTFSLASGTLPAGTVLVPSNGAVNGTLRGPGTFTFRIEASNGVSPDATSNPATVTVTGAPVTPDAPTIAGVTAGNGSATIAFTPPGYNGGAAVQSYTATSSPGGLTATGTTSPITVPGLTNGTAYTFTLTATNSVGTSAASAASAAVTPHAPPAVTATALKAGAAKVITAGATATVSATLTRRADHHAVGGAAVVLLSRAGKTGAFRTVTTVHTSAAGAVTAHVRPTRFTQYEFAFHATSTDAAATSGTEAVSVRSAVSLSAKAKKVKRNKVITLYGTVTPAHSGYAVTLQRLVKGKWVSAHKSAKEKMQKLPNGKKGLGFVITLKERKAGAYRFRVTSGATSANLAGASATVAVKVT